jgi:hypothetical protein
MTPVWFWGVAIICLICVICLIDINLKKRRGHRPLSASQPKHRQTDERHVDLGMEATDLNLVAEVNAENAQLDRLNHRDRAFK